MATWNGAAVSVVQALTVACPNCQSPIDEHCTRPTDFGRVPVMFAHLARETAYLERDLDA